MRRSLTFATLLVSWLFAVPGLLAAPQEPDKRDEKPEAAKPGARDKAETAAEKRKIRVPNPMIPSPPPPTSKMGPFTSKSSTATARGSDLMWERG